MYNEDIDNNQQGAVSGYDDVVDNSAMDGQGFSLEIIHHPFFQVATLCSILGIILSIVTPIAGWFICDGILISLGGASHLHTVVVLLLVGIFLLGLVTFIIGLVLGVLSGKWGYIPAPKEKYPGESSSQVSDSNVVERNRRFFIISLLITIPFSCIGLFYFISGLYSLGSAPSSAKPTWTNLFDVTGFGLGFLMLYFSCGLIAFCTMVTVWRYLIWMKSANPSNMESIYLTKTNEFIKKYVCCVSGQVTSE